MRIYIEEIEPKKLTYAKLRQLDDYFFEKKDVMEIFSEKGMYLVESNNVWRLVPTNEKINKITENEYTLLIDETIIERQKCSQLQMEHAFIKTTCFVYNTGKKSALNLVIEGKYNEQINTETIIDRTDKYSNFVCTNFYFEPKMQNTTILTPTIKNEINVFLSVLN
jgi:uncharacterized protein YfeS